MTEWALLRIWHVEMMDVVFGPTGYRFVRTSYLSAPAAWMAMSTHALAARVETVLTASYKLRNYQMRTDYDHSSMELLGFWFEWVDDADTPPTPGATTAPFLLPKTFADIGLARKVVDDLDATVQQPRAGLASRCYASGFERFRVDPNNDWLILDPADAKALFAQRHDAPAVI